MPRPRIGYDCTMPDDDRRNLPSPIAASIVALNGELAAQRFPLKTLQYVGLAHCSDSEICMTSTALGTSRRHLSLECVDGRFVVDDCGSSHGTFVNGERIAQPRTLANGDIIAAGQAEFRFELIA